MTFEDRIIAGIDRKNAEEGRSEFNKQLPEAHARAEAVLADCQIQESSFSDLYGTVPADISYVTDMMKRFGPEDEMRKYARVLEAMLVEQVELSNWFGENATTIKTSSYDDIKNGIDMIVRYAPTKESHTAQLLALGVDVTFSADGTGKKLTRIFENVENGKLGELKYFLSETDGYRGERKNLPLIVLGMEKGTLEEIGRFWVNRDNKALGKHPVQNMLLAQAQTQLSTMRTIARERGKRDMDRIISGPLEIIETEIKKRGPIALPHDRVWEAMQAHIRRLT